ncbi:MAG: DUF2442 domain-containing protein [Treponema sp.]|jgi:hypothetical protein|nr:DUF2442 domain-containing protein [Treponema sp.]
MTKMNLKYFSPKVVQVLPTDNFEVYAYLNDGSVRLYDAKPLLKKNTVFEPLMDIQTFKNKLTVINDTIAWDMGGNRDPYKCIDIDPLAVYEKMTVADPLTNGVV